MKHRSIRHIATVVAVMGVIAGYAVATIQSSPPGESVAAQKHPQTAPTAVLERIEALEKRLRAERKRNAEFQSDVAWLERRLEATAAGLETLLAASPPGAPSHGQTARVAEQPRDVPMRPHGEPPAREEEWDVAMARAGFNSDDIESYRTHIAEIEMERLYLADQAAREGWAGSERFREESKALAEEMEAVREAYGDDFYDWALYSSGRPNRVQIASVIDGSPAATSGIRTGDIIVGYGSDRVLRAADLQSGTRAGSIGETTRVEILRGGETVWLSVPRGPLGVRLRPARRAPLSLNGTSTP